MSVAAGDRVFPGLPGRVAAIVSGSTRRAGALNVPVMQYRKACDWNQAVG